MVKKNIYPGSSIFYRVTYQVDVFDFFLDFSRGSNNELIFVAGAYYDWMVKDAINRIVAFEK